MANALHPHAEAHQCYAVSCRSLVRCAVMRVAAVCMSLCNCLARCEREHPRVIGESGIWLVHVADTVEGYHAADPLKVRRAALQASHSACRLLAA